MDRVLTMAEPRIFFVTRKWAPAVGGMETYAMRLTEALARIEPVEVVALPGREGGMPPGPLALLLFPLKVLVRFLARREVPQVLHIADMAIWPLGLLGLLGGGKTQVILSAHGTDVSYHRRGGAKGRLYGAYLRLGARLLRRARVIANSRATAKVAAETGWNTAAVVPLATDMSGPEPDGSHNGRVLFVGRLVERKGCGWFVREVLPLLPETMGLDIAGTAWDRSEISALDDPRVTFLCSLQGDALAQAYRRALCVVVPNIATSSGEYEGFGLVAPEAAACGGLVLASDCDGLRDAVIDGETGFLLESGNALAWKEKIAQIAEMSPDQRKDWIARARTRAVSHYSWDRVARQTYEAALGGA